MYIVCRSIYMHCTQPDVRDIVNKSVGLYKEIRGARVYKKIRQLIVTQYCHS